MNTSTTISSNLGFINTTAATIVELITTSELTSQTSPATSPPLSSAATTIDPGVSTAKKIQTILAVVATTNSTNISSSTNSGPEGGVEINLGATLLAINVLIVVLNVFTIMVISRFRTKNAIDLFVLALACTDLVKGLIPVPMSIGVYLTNWRLNDDTPVCNFYGWIAFATNSGSMLILTFMSIERYLAVVKPFKYKSWVRPKKVLALLFFAWIFTAFHSSLPLFGMGRIKSYNDGAYSHFDYSRATRGTIAYSIFILCYGLSMIVVVMIAYSFVFHKIRDLISRHRRMSHARTRTISSPNSKSIRQLNLKTEKMFSYLTVVLMILFWFSWLPFLVVVIASQIDAEPPHENLDLFAMRIVVVNSMLNPIACAALCKPYRRGILYYIKRFFSYLGFKKPDDDIWDPWNRYARSHRNTRRLEPSVCEPNGRQSAYDYNEETQRLEDYTLTISSGSTSSGVSSSSSTAAKEAEDRRNNDDSKDHNKNILGIQGGNPTPSQSRKVIFMEKVHKYLGQKRRRSSAKESAGAQRQKRSNSAGDILDIDFINESNKKERKTRSFAVKSNRTKKDLDLDEEDENERLLIPKRGRSKTVSDMDEMDEGLDTFRTENKNSTKNKGENNTNDMSPKKSDRDLITTEANKHTNETENKYNLNGGVHKTNLTEERAELPSMDTDRRCISETYPENLMILKNDSSLDSQNPKMTTSEHSLVMIDKLTKDLVQFSQTSLNQKGMENRRIPLMPIT